MTVLQFPTKEREPLLLGPIEYHAVVVEGYLIPDLTGMKEGDSHTCLIVDGRFSIGIPNEYAHSVAWLIAQAMAVAKGYTNFKAAEPDRRFAVTVAHIGDANV